MKRIFNSFIFLFLAISLNGQWIQTNGPEGANIHDIQKVGEQIWAATAGGLYISDDEGLNWSVANFLPVENATGNILVLEDEIYLTVAVFDPMSSPWPSWDYFLFYSSDLGATWISNDLPPFSSFSNGDIDLFKINNSILFSSSSALFISDNNGEIWQEITTPTNIYQTACDGKQILIANYQASYISNDQGASWAFLDSIGTQSELFIEDSLILIETVFDEIHISEDMGLNWTVVSSPGGFGAENRFKRGDSGNLYFFNQYVYVSEDNGYSWNGLTTNTPNYAKVKNLVELSNGNYLYGTDKGVYQSANDGSQWFLSSNNMLSSTIYELSALPNGDILTNTNLGVYRSPNYGESWFSIDFDFHFPGFRSMIQKGDSSIIISNSSILLSTDNLSTFDTINSMLQYPASHFIYVDGTYYLLGYSSYYSTDLVNWNPLSIDDPNNPFIGEIDDLVATEDNALLANTDDGSVYRSEDGGQSWILVLDYWSPGVTNNYFHQIENRIYVLDDDDWFYSTDHGFTWNTTAMSGLPLGNFDDLPTEIAVIGNIIFTAMPDHGVYISSDLGETWTATNDGLASLRSTSLIYDNDHLYLGTPYSGVWRRGANFESVGGLVYDDLNSNGMQEMDELPLANILIQAEPLNTFTTTNSSGIYTLNTAMLNDTIKAIPPSPYSIVEPSYYLANQSATDLDFGVFYLPNMDDLCVTLTNLEPFRPGFDNRLILTIENVGTTTLSPSILLPINNGLSFINASPMPTQIDADTLIWELSPMAPFTTINISIEVVLDATTNIGTWLSLLAEVFPTVNDQNINNNSYALRTEVVGSYDPNDKQVEPSEYFTPDQLVNGEQLIYTVRFQNTGNYLAENVRIIDTLSPQLNLASFHLLSTSHPVEWNVRGANIVEFVFENILLPDSTSNEPASHGFVKFSVQPRAGLALGEEINNFADIYFDFNEPIRTNTTATLFDEVSSTLPIVDPTATLLISPNPANDQCYLSLTTHELGNGTLRFYDTKGALILDQNIQIGESPVKIALDHLGPGFYSVQLSLAGKVYHGKLIKQ